MQTIYKILLLFTPVLFLLNPISIKAQVPSVTANLIRTVDASKWTPPAPDTCGIVYLPSNNHLLVSDSEVDEMTIYQNANLYETTLDGTLIRTYNTLNFSREPTDIAVDVSKNLYFITDDDQQKLFVINLGTDKIFGTGDDKITTINAANYGCSDTEGVAFGNGKLYLACGNGSNITTLNPGTNGVFDGIDDTATSFSTASIGQTDPEGIEYNPDANTLFIISTTAKSVAETTTTGTLIRNINISALNAVVPSGLEYAPSSQNPSAKSLYIAARGIDNDPVPTENDGKIYEITFPALPTQITSSPSPTVQVTRTPTSTPQPACPGLNLGDANCDGLVDLIDFEIWRREFIASATTRNADYNIDGFVDLIDFEIWRRTFAG